MNFNTALGGLDDQAILVFNNTTHSVQELRYAIDVAMLSDLPQELIESLKSQGIQIELGTTDQNGQWQPLKEASLFQKGIDCKVQQPNAATMQSGRLKLKISLEFCLDEVKQRPERLLTSTVTAAKVASVSNKVCGKQAAEVPLLG
jgi:hypothetical protein